MNLGPTELMILLVIVLLLFGGKKLPELARSLGQAKREFEKVDDERNAEPAAKTTPRTVVQDEVDAPADVPTTQPKAAAPEDPAA